MRTRRRFRTVAKNQRHPITRRATRSVARTRSFNLMEHFAPFVDEQLRVAHDVHEEDMRDL